MPADVYNEAYALVKKYLDAGTNQEALAAWYDLQTRLPALRARAARA
jgi:hypothetical protein